MQAPGFHSAWTGPDGAAGVAGLAAARFPWWSFTKTVLAICALRLVERGRLELDAPRPGRSYTLRQLLQHRAGVRNYGALKAYHDAVARNDPAWPRQRLLDAVGADRLDFAPGTGWAYSNVGYLFVREAIEAATGLPLARALETVVFAGLDLPSVQLATVPADFADVVWPGLRGYDPRWVYHGCLTGTPVDAARLLHALFTTALVQPDTLRGMLDAYELGGALPGRPWTRHGYGLGLMIGKAGEAGRAWGHSGGGPFSTNAVYHFPDRLITVATFAGVENEGPAECEAASIARLNGRRECAPSTASPKE